ncbi:MAG: aspartate kinase [Candidatus Eisenbacteria bacterium]
MAKVRSGTLVVQKFGGTSLASPDRIKMVAAHLVEEKRQGKDVIVVVSAMGDTTDQLFELAKTVSPNPSKRELDMLLTAGERISMALLSMAISDLGYEAISFTGSQSGIVTDTSHTTAKILDVRAHRVGEELEKGRIVIVAGFQGVSPAKEVTTLGRGGSDTTCVALAAAFHAEECDIFTDVDGIYTADPRLVPRARKIEIISYDEMLELSLCGAQVLHWRSVEVARRFGVRVHVRSSFRKEIGTIVTAREDIETAGIRGITQDLDLVSVSVRDAEDAAGLAQRMLGALEEADIGVRFFNISPAGVRKGTISIMLQRDQKKPALSRISEVLPDADLDIDEGLATISIVGHGLCGKPGMAKKILASLASLDLQPEMISTSGITMTVAVKETEVVRAIQRLHTDLGLDKAGNSEGPK